MADPSAFAPFNLGEILARGQESQLRRLQLQNEQAKLQDSRDEKTALANIFGGGPAAPGAAPPVPGAPPSAGAMPGQPARPDSAKIGALMRVNPAMAFQVQKYFDGLGEDQRKHESDKWKAAGPLLVQMQQMPYAQRHQFMAAAAPALIANGWRPEEIQSFDPTDQNVHALAATAMTVDQVINSNKLDWHPIGENGSFATDQFGNPVGSGNPFAPQTQQAPQTGGTAPGITAKNNPGALRVPGSTQFQTFATPQDGIKAQEAQITRYMAGGRNTVASIIERYAPRQSKGGDNTDAQVNNYIKYVAGRIGVSPTAPLSANQVTSLAGAMREFETGHRPTAPRAHASPDDVRAKAQAAIAAGADPEKVRQRAAALGVTL